MIWIALTVAFGQLLISVVLWKVMRTFGVYAESLLYVHQQNLVIRQNLAIQETDKAIMEAKRRWRAEHPNPDEEMEA